MHLVHRLTVGDCEQHPVLLHYFETHLANLWSLVTVVHEDNQQINYAAACYCVILRSKHKSKEAAYGQWFSHCLLATSRKEGMLDGLMIPR